MADPQSRAGKRYGDEALIAYVDRLHAKHTDAMDAAFHAPERHDMPPIQVGPSDGRMLTLLLQLVGAKRVVEIGTLAGYSALRILEALPEGGRLWSIEYDAKHAQVARDVIREGGFAGQVEILEGAANDVLPQLERHGPFDAVFIDADKVNYDAYGRWARANLRSGGLLLGDNAYLFGDLMGETDAAVAMRRFHEEAAQHFDTVCIPSPDGLLLGIKR